MAIDRGDCFWYSWGEMEISLQENSWDKTRKGQWLSPPSPISPCGESLLQAQTSPLSTPTPSPALLQRRLSFTLYLEPITSWVLCVFLYHFASVCTPSKDRHPLQGTHSLKTRCQTGHQGVTTSEKEGEVSCPDLALNIQNCGQEQRGFLSCSLAFGTSLTQGWGGTG